MTVRFAVAVAAAIVSAVAFAAAEITDSTFASLLGAVGLIAGTYAAYLWYPAGWRPRTANARFYVLAGGVLFFTAGLIVVEAVVDGDLAGRVFSASAFGGLGVVVLVAAFRGERREG